MARLRIPVTPEDHTAGDPDAPCTVVEYGDYECPDCARAHPIVQRVQKHFGERLRFVFRSFPLTQIHPHAEMAAQTAEFAGAHGKFWPMHDLLMENQPRLSVGLFEELARELDLNPAALVASLEKGEYAERVRKNFNGGVRSGVNGTPTFFINGVRHDGPYDYQALVGAINATLAGD